MPSHHPRWLRKRLSLDANYLKTRETLRRFSINTVCEQSLCPNMTECFSRSTATFMILGTGCTRSCRFCAAGRGEALALDGSEPGRIAEAARELDLKHVVITSVTRDDLPDGGASHFASAIKALRSAAAKTTVEVLIPDFNGSRDSIETVMAAGPDILGHNIETVRRLYPEIRAGADYDRSLDLLRYVKSADASQLTKTGIMLGLGETTDEIVDAINDAGRTGCDMLTLGQYLRPGPMNIPAARFYEPEEFDALRSIALSIGFREVASGPFSRSSYFADDSYHNILNKEEGWYDRSQVAVVSRRGR